MILRKWDYSLHKYIPVELPDYYKIIHYTTDMNAITTCPHCRKRLKYGETYTSLEFHDEMGLGYHVCSKCYDEEWTRRRKAKDEEEK